MSPPAKLGTNASTANATAIFLRMMKALHDSDARDVALVSVSGITLIAEA